MKKYRKLLSPTFQIGMILVLVLTLFAAALPQKTLMAATEVYSGPAKMSVWIKNNQIYIRTENFQNATYLVKAREGTRSVGGWVKIGTLKTKKGVTQLTNYPLPGSLQKNLYIRVCLKNRLSNQMFCKVAVNPGGH
jgi:hypothetical protein